MTNIFDQMAAGKAETDSSQELTNELGNAANSNSPSTSFRATPADVRELTQELLKHGYLEESQKPVLFARAIAHEREIQTALEPLDLTLRLDTHRGVAFLAVAESADDDRIEQGSEQNEWSHRLVRRQRLTLEQSLLVALLRQAFVLHEQESGVGHNDAKIGLDELLPQFLAYFEDSGSDAKNESRLSNLLDQLKTYGIVSEVDKNLEVTIRPLIAHLASPESLKSLLKVLKEKAAADNNTEPLDRPLASSKEQP